MSNLRNRVQLAGHLGIDPESKTFSNGGTVVRFRVATNENYKNAQGEWVEHTEWHPVALYGQVGERAMKQLTKGSYVLIEGKLTHNQYTDAQGNKKYFTEVKVTNFMKLDKKSASIAEGESAESMEDNSGLPF